MYFCFFGVDYVVLPYSVYGLAFVYFDVETVVRHVNYCEFNFHFKNGIKMATIILLLIFKIKYKNTKIRV